MAKKYEKWHYDTKIYVYDENQVNISCVDDSCNDPAGNPYRSDMVECVYDFEAQK